MLRGTLSPAMVPRGSWGWDLGFRVCTWLGGGRGAAGGLVPGNGDAAALAAPARLPPEHGDGGRVRGGPLPIRGGYAAERARQLRLRRAAVQAPAPARPPAALTCGEDTLPLHHLFRQP